MRMGAVIVSALLLSLAVVTLATEGEYITTGRLNSEAEVDTDSTVEAEAETEEVAFVETAATTTAQTGHQNFCEVCILMMQLRQNNKPQICKGLAPEHWLTCVGILESLLRADKALVYWEKNGCLHMDSNGPQIVKPCPALPVCSWVPNLFGNPPSIVRDGVEPICPKDNKYMPVIPPNFQPVNAQGAPELPPV